jgi:hypothetical protein
MNCPAGDETSADARTAAEASAPEVSDPEQAHEDDTIGARTNNGRIRFDTRISIGALHFGDHPDLGDARS